MLKALLSYQEIDRKLYKIENELAKSEEKKKYSQLRKFLKSAPEKVDALENKAAALRVQAAELTKRYEQLETSLGDFENLDELVSGGADISFYKKKVQAIVDQLKKVKADLNALVANVQATDEEYKLMKKKVKAASKQYEDAKTEYEKLEKTSEEERSGYKAQLTEAAKNVPSTVLERYLAKRKEGRPFPLVGVISAGRCPSCRMEIPIAAQSKLADGIECDSCRMIIFKE